MSFLKTKPQSIDEQERLAWVRLYRTRNVGVVNFHKLIKLYGSASAALEALPELAKRGGAAKPLEPPKAEWIEKEARALAKMKGRFLTLMDEEYPEALRACGDAPPVLSVIGDVSLMNKNCIAMVGARNASLNGRKFAGKLAKDLGARGQVIVSGLARGIDTAAHEGALESGTIAVVAGGIDVIYPEENAALYKEIGKRGLIIAESPMGMQPFRESFPRRNRIVSGLSKGTIVVEATLKSGSLITARLAGEQGRDVFAVPGHPLDPRAAGPNALIRDGAVLIRGVEDVLENLIQTLPLGFSEASNDEGFEGFAPPEAIDAGTHERVLGEMSFSAVGIDELLRSCHVSAAAMQTILLELDLAGRIERLPGNRVRLLES